MAKYNYYSITALISLFIIASCAPGSTPTGNDAVYQLNVTVDPPEAGTVTPSTAELIEGDEVEISASPNEGWIFDRWQGDHSGSENPLTVTMDRDKDILALFIKREYPLTITIEGEGVVSERVVQNKTTDYPHGTTVELTANPASGWVFSHWEGDVDAEGNPVQIVIDSEKEVTAVFVVREFNLVIQTEGEGTVSERMIPDASSPHHTVELTANPSEGWRFVEWKGDVSGSDNPVRTTMDREKQVTAVFEKREYPLTVNTVGEGSVSEEVIRNKVTDYPHGTTVQLTANPSNGWTFSRWEGDLTGSENPEQIEVTEEKVVTAIFVRESYQISVSVEGEGTVSETLVTGTGEEGVYEFNSVVELSARPSDGWRFSHWTGDADGSTNPVSVEMDSDKNVTAVFEQRSYDLTIHIEGEGTVSEEVVEEGKVVKLTATAASGWIFDRWEGDLTGSENPSQVEITTEKEITAIFKKGHFALNIEVTGNGSVQKDLQSGNESGGLYELGSEVQLTTSSDTGWRFDNWSGDASGNDNPVTVVIGINNNVSAAFVRQAFALSTDTEGQGSVSESLVSGTAAQGGYLYESVVELAATPASGWIFSHWTGDLTGSENPGQITISSDKQVTAVFERRTYDLTVNIEGEGTVTEEVVSSKSTEYPHGTTVKLTAAPASGWEFSHWTGDLTGSENPAEITISSEKEVTAVFERNLFDLTVNTQGEGSVGKSLQSGSESDGKYESGSIVELTATADEGWKFSHWTGDVTGSDNPEQITMNSSKTVTAVFEEESFTLTVNTEGEGSVGKSLQSGSESDGQYESGSVVELTATAEEGWEFIRWEGDLSGDQNPQSITMDTDKTVTAVFEEEEEFSGGDGTVTNPYQVSNIDELQRMADYPDAHFVQINNISAGATTSWNDGKGFKPVGTFNSPFRGTYDGDGFEISGLAINRPNEEYVGLFGNADGATIKNTRLVNVTIKGDREVGGLVGIIYRAGTIENSHVRGTISGNDNVGGLTGNMTGTILTDSHTLGNVSGDFDIGGLVGLNGGGGRIVNSHSESHVSGKQRAGGLAGTNSRRGTIENSYATGNISGTDDQIGGLVGLLSSAGHISDCHATGNVTGDERVGGLVGDNGGGSITNCYATGNVSGSDMLGGLVGKIVGPGVINRSHASGNVTGGDMLGGLVGSKHATHINDSYAIGNVTGEDEIGGLAGVSIAGQIKNSYALGRVTGEDAVGGLVGVNDTGGHFNAHDAGKIYDSYAHGVVTGEDDVGGLVGINTNQAVITTSYAKGRVSGDDNIGGLVGLNEADVVSSYWDIEATGQSEGAGDGSTDGTTGLTTSEMTGPSAETNMPEFDWNSIWMTSPDYPILRWQEENLTSN